MQHWGLVEKKTLLIEKSAHNIFKSMLSKGYF